MSDGLIGERIQHAIEVARLSQREVAAMTGISQSTLSRIISGSRIAKLPELILIADATGVPVRRITGSSVETRVQYAARAANGSSMEQMRETLVMFLELDAYLEDQAIP